MSDTAPRPRVIERWFPCEEVSISSRRGWGSSASEIKLFSWFAKRPLAQARAATLCSLLEWPDTAQEQNRLQQVVRESLGHCVDPDYVQASHGVPVRPHKYGIRDCARYDQDKGYGAARRDVLELISEQYPGGAQTLDPFSGRGLLPLESARYGVHAESIDYSPVAALASRLLVRYPFKDWTSEPSLPYEDYDDGLWRSGLTARLVHDVEATINEVERKWLPEVDPYFPNGSHGQKPWGYVWAATIPCEECGLWFPLYGSNRLRHAKGKSKGQSFELEADDRTWSIRIVDGQTAQAPTARALPGKNGKLAWCPNPNCGHVHSHKNLLRVYAENFAKDEILVVADFNGPEKFFRLPRPDEIEAPMAASEALMVRSAINGLPVTPTETIPPANSTIIVGSVRGAVTFGDLSNPRQTLVHAAIAEAIDSVSSDLRAAGVSQEYVEALSAYAGANLAKKLKFSTRGASLGVMSSGTLYTNHIFANEGVVGFNYDYFETGIGDGPGTWRSVPSTSELRKVVSHGGRPATVQRGSALSLPFRPMQFDAIVTDPPYDKMIAYSDASDLFYVWLRRALGRTHPDFALTAHSEGLQEKDEEIIVKKDFETWDGEHRRPEFYDTKIAEAFAEMRRVVKKHGVVTIVFGHGEPEVWRRLLTSIEGAGLVLTGSWPAKTEKGGSAGSANIVTTLTLACRPAPLNRPDGRVAEVDAEVRRVVADRVKNLWDPAGLAVDDQLMAAAGPAMEVVGRYSRVLDKTGKPVDISRYLPLARRAVEDAQDIRLDSLPLATFDTRTRFGLFWARLHGRRVQAASEARWQRLAADMEEDETAGVLKAASKGVRLAYSDEVTPTVEDGSPIFDVALAAAHAWRTGSLADAASALRASGRDADDPHLWACINALSKALPETDKDGEVFTRMVRNRESVVAAARNVEAAEIAEAKQVEQRQQREKESPRLFEDPNSLFGQEGL